MATQARTFTQVEQVDAAATKGPDPDPFPGTTGNVRVDFGIFFPSAGFPSGSGVLSRLTLEAVRPGVSPVTISDRKYGNLPAPQIFDQLVQEYPIGSVQNGVVAV